jgi:divalent metal cation (Fe/Co/Zn/Cd) transporter
MSNLFFLYWIDFYFKALFILKIVGAVISRSLSVISSLIDSAVDLATSVILFWAWRIIKKRDKYRYPQGIFMLRLSIN